MNSGGQVKNVIGIGVVRLESEIHIELWKIGLVENRYPVSRHHSQRTEYSMIDYQFDIIRYSTGEASFVQNFKSIFLCDLIEDNGEEKEEKEEKVSKWATREGKEEQEEELAGEYTSGEMEHSKEVVGKYTTREMEEVCEEAGQYATGERE